MLFVLIVITSCQDETHDTHHPISGMRLSNILLFHLKLIDHYYRIVGLYYEDQKEAALERAKDFRENRVPKFF